VNALPILVQPEADDPGLSNLELRNFFLQLSVMLSAGVQLVQGLETLATDRSQKGGFVSHRLADLVSSGHPLSRSLARLRYSFDQVIVSLVAVGEKTGKLDLILRELAKRVDQRCRYRQQLTQALAYPVMVMVVSFVLIAVLSQYMLPVMLDFTKGMAVETPWPTRVLMTLVELRWLAFVVLGVFVFLLCDLYWGLRDETSGFRSWVLYRSPIIGEINSQKLFMELCQDLALMLDAGCLLTQALSALSPASPDPVVGRVLLKVRTDLEQGATLEESLVSHPEIPKLVSGSLAVGSEVGKPQHLLKTVVVLLQADLDSKTERMMALIEPFTMAFMGLVVGGILLASLLPIYSVVTGNL
jgi:type IV pilus assembly protein PilC